MNQKPLLDNARQTLRSTGKRLQHTLERGLDRNIRVAVTGLSQSGKTAFITSLVSQLMNGNQSDNLPFFEVVQQQRLLAVRQQTLTNLEIPQFPYRDAIKHLVGDRPSWPESTRNVSEIRLELCYRASKGFRKFARDSSRLTVDIIDYPGEWLLDLPLLELEFHQWSQLCAERYTSALYQQVLQDVAQQIASVDLTAVADDQLISELSAGYRNFLQRCQQPDAGVSIIQPGRFVLPGDLEGAPVLDFFPALGVEKEQLSILEDSPLTSFYQQLKQRYNAYRDQVVKPFYKDFFSSFDRQVVLVDCLRPLNLGVDCFMNMREAIESVLPLFSYGRSSVVRRLFAPKIDRVLFAATKSDHVTPNQHRNLEEFLRRLIDQNRQRVTFDGVQSDVLALAGVCCTELVEASVDGQRLSCLRGIAKSSGEQLALFPGEIPPALPSPDEWNQQRFRFVDFMPPPRASISEDEPLPHIRMDQALQFLLGDKLR